ncbi:hypothetical protein P43SY_000931 [Pythium insidiosum]|uniref:Uncharacterized protein n=1 Tax=Pythium insidiosum TaxID=114742 RepID=A0AAD5Q2G3_PYTIN|nr:hypothetical protein P43SY_000931 [Pythium insidiosum]
MADNNETETKTQPPPPVSRALELSPASLKPAPRGGATLTQAPNGDVFLIGGANRDALSFGDVYCLDLASKSWSYVRPAGGSLSPRSGHSAVAFGHQLVVFGGLDASRGAVLNDVQVFDTETKRWWTPRVDADADSRDRPTPRNAHAAIRLARDRMLVFGGSSPFVGAMDDLFVLHIPVEDDAHDAPSPGASTPWRWERIETTERPAARELHAACWLPGAPRRICFVGGRGRDGALCDDVAVLDVARWTWTLQRPPNAPQCWQRCAHRPPNAPQCWQRCAHVAAIVDRQLVSVGGWDGAEISADAWVLSAALDSDVGTWEPRALEDATKRDRVERFGHCGCVVRLPAQDHEPEEQQQQHEETVEAPDKETRRRGQQQQQHALLVFGGMNADRDLQDLVVIAPAALAL